MFNDNWNRNHKMYTNFSSSDLRPLYMGNLNILCLFSHSFSCFAKIKLYFRVCSSCCSSPVPRKWWTLWRRDSPPPPRTQTRPCGSGKSRTTGAAGAAVGPAVIPRTRTCQCRAWPNIGQPMSSIINMIKDSIVLNFFCNLLNMNFVIFCYKYNWIGHW